MGRFFVRKEAQLDDGIVLKKEDAHHLQVLRTALGEEILVTVGEEKTYRTRLISLDNTGAQVQILSEYEKCTESPLEITLYQGLAKGEKNDWVTQKAVELGVFEIVFFPSTYTMVRLDAKKEEKKQERLQRIAYEAAKQCHRSRIPTVRVLPSFDSLKKEIGSNPNARTLVPYEKAVASPIASLTPSSRVFVVIGPEGGFAKKEVEDLELLGAYVVSLGPRILRTETAGIVVLSVLQYAFGDL